MIPRVVVLKVVPVDDGEKRDNDTGYCHGMNVENDIGVFLPFYGLETFGIGKEFSDAQWRSIVRQLVVRGFLTIDHSRYGALQLTENSRELLRGEVTLQLREDPVKPKSRPNLKAGRRKIEVELEDEPLLEALRALRKSISDEENIPPYVVFHDVTLAELIEQRPSSLAELLDITGVGQAKLQKYGQRILDVLQTF